MVVRGQGVGYKKARLVFFWSGNRECSPWAFDEKHMLLDGMDLMIHSGREGPFEPSITIFRDTRLKNLICVLWTGQLPRKKRTSADRAYSFLRNVW